MRRWIQILCSAVVIVASLAATAAAQTSVPAQITQQGRVVATNGTPLGTLDVTFTLYTALTGGTVVWTETQIITFDDGYFSAQLGSATPFGAGVWTGATLYLGVTIGADPEMTPREVISSVPYALLAGDVYGDIHPDSVTINGIPVINDAGVWVGPSNGLVGATGAAGA